MENIIGTKIAVRLLSALLRNPCRKFKENELIKESGVGKGAGADTLDKLSSFGIIKIKRIGKTKAISLNAANPMAFSLRQLFDYYKFFSLPKNKTAAVLFFKERAYECSRAIILFGSLAAGTYDEKSDIDLLVIADDERGINKARANVSELTGEKINVHFLKPADAEKGFEESDLIRNAATSGILIYGGSYIREVAREHMDLKELEFLKERINAAWRNYANKDFESAGEILSAVREDMAFLICGMEGAEALSRKDAISKIKRMKEFRALAGMDKLKIERQLETVEDAYSELLSKAILRGECIEGGIEK